MKIAFVGGRLSRRASGVKVVVERLSAALAEIGQEIRVFGLKDDAWTQGDSEVWSGAPAQVFPVRWNGALGYAPGLTNAVNNFAPDLVHLHGLWMFGSIVSARAARRGIANVVSPHGMLDDWALQQSKTKKFLAGLMFEKRHLKNASALHALNAQEADAIRGYGIKQPLAVLPNGVDLPSFETTISLPSWHDNLPRDAKILLYLGRLHSKKNLKTLIEAFAIAKKEPWHLVIAGPDQDNEADALLKKTAEFGLRECVHLVGPQFEADKTASLGAAHGFVLPSLSEGLPMAVLEAWAAHLPVLMSDQCNLPEGFKSGAAIHSGILKESIASSLDDLFSMSDSARYSMGVRGYNLVANKFSWTSLAAEYTKLYEWSCEQTGKPMPDFIEMSKFSEIQG